MPDVTPLSGGKRVLTTVVLVGLLALSLGAAEMVVMRQGPGRRAERIAVTFTLDNTLGLKEVAGTDGRELEGPGGRKGAIIIEPVGPHTELEDMEVQAEKMFETETNHDVGQEPDAVTLDGYKGIELRDVRRLKHDFAVMRMFLVEDQMVGVLYVGETAFTAADQKVFDGLVKGFAIRKVR